MIQILPAERLLETSLDYPEYLELKTGDSWLVIEGISRRYPTGDGVWYSDGDHIYITCRRWESWGDGYHVTYACDLMEPVTVRWHE